MGINADETLVVYQAMVGIQEIRHIKILTFDTTYNYLPLLGKHINLFPRDIPHLDMTYQNNWNSVESQISSKSAFSKS